MMGFESKAKFHKLGTQIRYFHFQVFFQFHKTASTSTMQESWKSLEIWQCFESETQNPKTNQQKVKDQGKTKSGEKNQETVD